MSNCSASLATGKKGRVSEGRSVRELGCLGKTQDETSDRSRDHRGGDLHRGSDVQEKGIGLAPDRTPSRTLTCDECQTSGIRAEIVYRTFSQTIFQRATVGSFFSTSLRIRRPPSNL